MNLLTMTDAEIMTALQEKNAIRTQCMYDEPIADGDFLGLILDYIKTPSKGEQ
ncbi:MAG: hypothetical protein FWG87_14310 [Defluviitaleaceae bacterium]|nr:hypothetical protein [Defluviitaleaceae bacterium]